MINDNNRKFKLRNSLNYNEMATSNFPSPNIKLLDTQKADKCEINRPMSSMYSNNKISTRQETALYNSVAHQSNYNSHANSIHKRNTNTNEIQSFEKERGIIFNRMINQLNQNVIKSKNESSISSGVNKNDSSYTNQSIVNNSVLVKKQKKKVIKPVVNKELTSLEEQKSEIKEKLIKLRLKRREKEREFSEVNFMNKSIDNIKTNDITLGGSNLEQLLLTNKDKIEYAYFPYKIRDEKKLNEMAKFLKSSVTVVMDDPFFKNYENKINFISDSRILPNLKANLVHENDSKVDNITFKNKVEKIEHPNIINPSALFQINIIRKMKQTKKDKDNKKIMEKTEEKKIETTINQMLGTSIANFKKILSDGFSKKEESLNFFKYRLEAFNNIQIETGILRNVVLNLK